MQSKGLFLTLCVRVCVCACWLIFIVQISVVQNPFNKTKLYLHTTNKTNLILINRKSWQFQENLLSSTHTPTPTHIRTERRNFILRTPQTYVPLTFFSKSRNSVKWNAFKCIMEYLTRLLTIKLSTTWKSWKVWKRAKNVKYCKRKRITTLRSSSKTLENYTSTIEAIKLSRVLRSIYLSSILCVRKCPQN